VNGRDVVADIGSPALGELGVAMMKDADDID
jgi:hypothetical protein